MRIAVLVFFNFKSPVFLFKFYADINVYVNVARLILIILYITTAELSGAFNEFSFLIYKCQNAEVIFFACFKIICPKSGSSMNNTGSILSCDEIAGDNLKRVCPGSLKPYMLQRI